MPGGCQQTFGGGEQVESGCRTRVRYVHVVDGFPVTVTGKVRKVEMRSAAVDVLGLSDAAAVRSA